MWTCPCCHRVFADPMDHIVFDLAEGIEFERFACQPVRDDIAKLQQPV